MYGSSIRWEEVLRELRDAQAEAEETVALWGEYTQRSERCSLQLQTLWQQWEAMVGSTQQEAQVHSAEVSCLFVPL